jgi:opacity protein-like surface antigen
VKRLATLALFLAALIPAAAAAQADDAGQANQVAGPAHAAGIDVFYQSDADDTEVVRTGINLDVVYHGPEQYRGVRLEKAWFNPLGLGWHERDRVYFRAADDAGDWKWQATLGTDGKTVLGSATVHDESSFRKEFFVEREVLETPQGLGRGIYYTFAGAAIDLPADDRNVFTVVAGVQDFTGDNVRVHLRANYIHVLKPDWGLSAQLRTRWFHNSDPREADYYSPRWYVQILPLLQLRRTTDSGWHFLAAGGLGVQRDAGSRWRRASYLNAQVTSPHVSRGWALTANALFTETPTASGQSYRYLQFSAGVVRAF